MELFLALETQGSWEDGAAFGFQTDTVPCEGGVMAHFWLGWWPQGQGQP